MVIVLCSSGLLPLGPWWAQALNQALRYPHTQRALNSAALVFAFLPSEVGVCVYLRVW